MRNEFTAILEKDGDWYIAYCPEVPGANGQGKTMEECRQNLAEAIALVLDDRLASLARPARSSHPLGLCARGLPAIEIAV